ncbi:NB-ARC domain containing protein [Dorcoceras hygrometricum]|uniref:NB-ARC domain containing protein n=1 Tax=Dorcoceras hygrometricum TaxID=472368 RepID=A0A2Z7A2C7_9LAMI|nr:NB-ARC domain containing protein [Dorcoceras hygrometricum]
MASDFITNALQVNFGSVLGISDNDEMVNMFKALESTGLRDFLGCPSVLYEQEHEQFFDTALVQDGDITCVVFGKYVAIPEDRFAGIFNLPTESLTDLSEVPNNLVLQARTLFSKSSVPVQFSCKKRLMKYEFRLLNDILAKSITVKAGDPTVTLGEAKTFPPLKILSAKTVNTYVATNKTIDARGESDEPEVAKIVIVKKKSVSKRKSASIADKGADEVPVEVVAEKVVSKKRSDASSDAPVVKKTRTTTGKAASKKKDLGLVSLAPEVVPIQMIEPISAVPAERPPTPKRNTLKRKFRMLAGSDDEIVEKEPDVEEPILDQSAGTEKMKELEKTVEIDDVDTVIEKILSDTAQMETDVVEPDFFEGVAMGTDLTDMEEDSVKYRDTDIQFIESATKKDIDLEPVEDVGQIPLDEESLSIDDLLKRIQGYMMLPSVIAAEPAKIKFSNGISITGVYYGYWFKENLPNIAVADKGKAPLVEPDTIKGHPAREMFHLICDDIEFLVQLREKTSANQIDFLVDNPVDGETPVTKISLPAIDTTDVTESFSQLRASITRLSVNQLKTSSKIGDLQNHLLFKIENLEKAFTEALAKQEQVLHNIIHSARQETQNQKAALSLEILKYQKEDRAQHAVMIRDLTDIRSQNREIQALKKDFTSFQQKTESGIAHVSSQLSEIIAYINRVVKTKGEKVAAVVCSRLRMIKEK